MRLGSDFGRITDEWGSGVSDTPARDMSAALADVQAIIGHPQGESGPIWN
jgi:hypothetical protein